MKALHVIQTMEKQTALLREMFKVADLDKDGKLGANEFALLVNPVCCYC